MCKKSVKKMTSRVGGHFFTLFISVTWITFKYSHCHHLFFRLEVQSQLLIQNDP